MWENFQGHERRLVFNELSGGRTKGWYEHLTIQKFVCKHLNFIPQAAKQSMSSHCHHIVISVLLCGSLYFH